ncbi:unnamed protein product [Moneuplotes crassus]|uniref:CRAL-TRIO domain-containing protein n=1 Tax=Euplotes crassus TaxID=5936 RepID=A0AAD1Y656_EUPCR|nr:unnamed protein product [Moneuplotes crassus]
MKMVKSLSHVNHKVDFFSKNKEEDYIKKIDNKVISVIEELSMIKIEEFEDIERYDYKAIRNFLVANKCDVGRVVDIIQKDISWRKRKFPFCSTELKEVIQSEKLYLYGSDKDMNPCFYFKPFSKPGIYFQEKSSEITMKNYLDYIIYCFETCNQYLIGLGFNTTFTMLVDCDDQKIDSEASNFYFDSIWEIINNHYPCKIAKIHLVKVQLKTSFMIHGLRLKNVIFHDEFYQSSLLAHFNQYQLCQEYGGCALEKYDITQLKNTNDLPGFITSYVKLPNEVTPC